MVSLSLGITTAEFDQVFADQKVTVSSSIASITLDPIYGQASEITYSDSAKQWIFFKNSSELSLKMWGIVEVADAYVIMEITDSIAFGDRVTYDSEIFEFTPDCKSVYRYANG
ncbi:hypothetical protein LCGC14_2520840, partial [marine sediment metagenome]